MKKKGAQLGGRHGGGGGGGGGREATVKALAANRRGECLSLMAYILGKICKNW